MLRLSTVQAKPGMRLAMPVYHPKQGSAILLRAGAVLQEKVIQRLREFNVAEMWIQYPELGQVADCISEEVNQARVETMQVLSEAFNDVRPEMGAQLDYRVFRKAIVDLIDSLIRNPRAALLLEDMNGCAHPPLQHSANVAFVSLLIGLKLDFYLEHQRSRLEPARAREVSSLGLGALLHDVGAMDLEPDVVEEYLRTADEYEPNYRRHVVKGFERVRGHVDPTAATVVLHHHQHFDGTGYPARESGTGIHTPTGTDIHVFARIVAAADKFDSLRHPPHPADAPEVEPMPTVRALRLMGQPPYRETIDPIIYLGLLAVVPPYPPGSTVELSNGAMGVVTRWNPADPCRPVVREIGDLEHPDQFAPGVEFDLGQQQGLIVVKAQGQDVADDNFFPTETTRFDLHGVARALINRAADQPGNNLRQAG